MFEHDDVSPELYGQKKKAMNDRRHRDRREQERAKNRSNSKGAMMGIGWAVFGAVVGLSCLAFFTSTGSPPKRTSPEPERISNMSANRVAAYMTDNAIIAGAIAAENDNEDRNKRPRSLPVKIEVRNIPAAAAENGLVISHIRSRSPHAQREGAIEDAIEVAQEEIRKQLALMEPPITAEPRKEMIREKLMRKNSIREIPPTEIDKEDWKKANLEPDRFWVELDIELSEASLRELRSQERSGVLIRIMAATFVLLLGVYSFLRLDLLTKGYLSTALGIVLAIVGLGALVFVIR
jgi:hypothetical protein